MKCPKCGLSWGWIEVYSFERCEDIRQIEDNDH